MVNGCCPENFLDSSLARGAPPPLPENVPPPMRTVWRKLPKFAEIDFQTACHVKFFSNFEKPIRYLQGRNHVKKSG